MLTHQVGLDRAGPQEPTFRHEVALLGELRWPSATALTALVNQLQGPAREVEVVGRLVPVSWSVIAAEQPHALRYFLTGTAVSYPVDRLNLLVHQSGDHTRGHDNGLAGVFQLPPLFLCDNFRWWCLATLLRGSRLFSCFGSWRPGQQPAATSTPTRHAVRTLPQVKQGRQAAVRQRRAQLLTQAQTLGDKLLPPAPSGRGRPPCRRTLAEALQRAGVQVSRRDLEWLQRALRR